ncbi:class I poly(R)-hydroxyalkanoic acid synthase [soil metagenome]
MKLVRAPAPLFEDSDTPEFGKALVGAVARSARHPRDLAAAGVTYAGSLAALAPPTFSRLFGTRGATVAAPSAEARPDKRFADAAWSDNAAFFALHGAYVAGCRLGDDVLDAGSKNPGVDAKARLAWQLLSDALAPTNFLLTNPAALRQAVRTGGRSVATGAGNFARDLVSNNGKPRQVDNRGFEVGENLAATRGTVVFRNDLMELIQYAPQTEQVHAVPLLAVPPWINKYYVMDLAPGRSLLEWAVQHQRTVFVISYRNADESLRDVTMDDYLTRGPLAAIDAIRDITGAPVVDLLGLCIGGAMAAMTAAYLAQEEPDRIGSVTLLNTLLDYSDPGALGVFTDERSVARLEHQMARTGFLEADQMAGTFDALRPNDLIFGYVVSSWLLGEDPPAFDILSWNADSTRMPGAMHGFYLRSLYVDNLLMRDELELAGRRLRLGDVTAPAYVVGAVNDHIVPWTASYQATQLLGGDVRYVLSNGGHIAGVVNPPGPKAWHLVAEGSPASPSDWRASAAKQEVTWWEDWTAWSSERAGGLVAPPQTGSVAYPSLGAAPGDYIRT